MNPVLTAGLLVNSALYFSVVFVAALVGHHQVAMYADIAAIGITYLSYYAQLAFPEQRSIAFMAVFTSVALGAFAGVSLL